MAGEASAYAILGLEPDADSAAIDRAYKRLIKLHHPDREGGDSVRAADINRAYRDLRGPSGKHSLEFNESLRIPGDTRWPAAAVLTAIAVGVAVLAIGPVSEVSHPRAPTNARHVAPARVASEASSVDPMDAPLNSREIDAAARRALTLSRTKDEFALANASRDCQRAFRDDPGLELLDRCAAFDDAVVLLQDRDPLRDQGPFAQLDVTGRQWNAASALSNDYISIDGRLDRIRLRVEMMLAPEIPPVAN